MCAQFNHDALERKRGRVVVEQKMHRALNFMLRHVSISNFLLLLSRINCIREEEWSSFSFFIMQNWKLFLHPDEAVWLIYETLSFTTKLFDFVCTIYCNKIDNDKLYALLYADLPSQFAGSFLKITCTWVESFKELYLKFIEIWHWSDVVSFPVMKRNSLTLHKVIFHLKLTRKISLL